MTENGTLSRVRKGQAIQGEKGNDLVRMEAANSQPPRFISESSLTGVCPGPKVAVGPEGSTMVRARKRENHSFCCPDES